MEKLLDKDMERSFEMDSWAKKRLYDTICQVLIFSSRFWIAMDLEM